MPLEPETIAAAVERGDGTVRWTCPEGHPFTGPYDAGRFVLLRGGSTIRGVRMEVDAADVVVHFPFFVEPGDEAEAPPTA